MSEELRLAKALIVWMDVFAAAGVLRELEPSTADWKDYSLAEKAIALRAAQAALKSMREEKSTISTI